MIPADIPFAILMLIGFFFYMRGRFRHANQKPVVKTDGWLWFAASRESPVKVGASRERPTSFMPELQQEREPMRLVYEYRVSNMYQALEKVEADLNEYRVRGRWYDRDAALFYVDHLKGSI